MRSNLMWRLLQWNKACISLSERAQISVVMTIFIVSHFLVYLYHLVTVAILPFPFTQGTRDVYIIIGRSDRTGI